MTKRWSYSCATLARFYEVDKATVETWVKRKVFDPSDLASIFALKVKRDSNTEAIAIATGWGPPRFPADKY